MDDVTIESVDTRKIENGYLLSWYERSKETECKNYPVPCVNKQMVFSSVTEAAVKIEQLLG